MAESVYATPPSPDLSDEDMVMHHPVVILDERASPDDQVMTTTSASAAVSAHITSPLSPIVAATNNPSEPSTAADNELSAQPSYSSAVPEHYASALADNGTAETAPAFPSFQHQPQALAQQQPDENASRSQSPTNNHHQNRPQSSEPSSPVAVGHVIPPFALPFADFAAQLLKASGNNGQPFHDHHLKSKRRKQSAPNRLSGNESVPAAVNLTNYPNGNTGAADEDHNSPENVARRQFLADFTQKLAAIVEQQDFDKRSVDGPSGHASNYDANEENSHDGTNDTVSLENGELQSRKSVGDAGQQLDCNQCPARFDNELKLGMHMLQMHGAQNHRDVAMPDNPTDPAHYQIRVKQEMRWQNDEPDQMQQHSHQAHLQHSQKSTEFNDNRGAMSLHENWLPMGAASGLPFPFSPEAAAMLSASGYLGQMPQLLAGQMTAGSFGSTTGPDGLPRSNIPPIRIFNPEAYCDLCNKEFCNKYFLKTHKANKHNIYESMPTTSGPGTTTTTSSSSSSGGDHMNHNQPSTSSQQQQHQQQQQLNHMSQMYMQQQQQQHHHQMQQINQQQLHDHHQTLSVAPPPPPPVDTTVPCDVCHRRFSNAASMRRHRAKAHDPALAAGDTVADLKSESKFTLPDGFREDFTIEQEDTSFTPQIRKLSPASSQMARDSNFSNDKLRRLGVINPEAFCEICCKEYCNKYFLRTHKIKRHGIYMPMDDQQQQIQSQPQKQQHQPPTAAALLSGIMGKEDANKWLQFVQTTPLNLMMGVQHEINLAGKRSINQLLTKQEDDSSDQTKSHTPDAKRSKLLEPTATNNEYTVSQDSAQQAAQDAISVDLQKLQSMIMQLNDLSAQRPATCSICSKDFDNQYVLHAHVLAEHAPSGNNKNNDGSGDHLGIDTVNIKTSPPSTPPPTMSAPTYTPPRTGELACKLCDKDFVSELALRHHMFEAHGGGPIGHQPQQSSVLPPAPTTSVSPSALALQNFAKKMADRTSSTDAFAGGLASAAVTNVSAAERRPYTITPTSSYCEICNKELCNKYFMKTHMQRMHGIEIENGAQIGGVICNICNKELCSKYFLRVHKHNTHGIVDEGAPLPVPRGSSSANSNSHAAATAAADSKNGIELKHAIGNSMIMDQQQHPNEPTSTDLKPGEINDRYYTHAGEVCPLCNRRFRGAKWLRTHLMSDHGKAGVDKLRDLEHSVALTKQHQASPPMLRIPGSSANNNNPFDVGMHLNMKQPSTARSAKPHHKHDISSLFGPGQLDDIPAMSGGKVKEYSCTFCPFTTPSYAFLFIHERSHTLVAAGLAGNQTNDSESAIALTSTNGHPANVSPFGIQFPALSPSAALSQEADAPMNQRSPHSPNKLSTASPLQTPPPPAVAETANLDKSASSTTLAATAHVPAATQAMLNELANAANLPTAYALPAHSTASDMEDGAPLVMQSFLMEEEESEVDGGGTGDERERHRRFVPSIVYLPVKQRFPDKLVVSFTLTPA